MVTWASTSVLVNQLRWRVNLLVSSVVTEEVEVVFWVVMEVVEMVSWVVSWVMGVVKVAYLVVMEVVSWVVMEAVSWVVEMSQLRIRKRTTRCLR